MYKTVLLPSPLSPPPSASLSFSLRPPSAIRRLHRAAASTMSQFPRPRRHDDRSRECRTPSFPVLRAWSITIRRSHSRSLAPPDPLDACHRADLLSRPRRSAIDTSLHQTRRHVPCEAGASCRPVPPTTRIRFHEDWRIFFEKRAFLSS
jgi:hypothetical protein